MTETTRIEGANWKITEQNGVFFLYTRQSSEHPWFWIHKSMGLDVAVRRAAKLLFSDKFDKGTEDDFDISAALTVLKSRSWRISKYKEVYIVQTQKMLTDDGINPETKPREVYLNLESAVNAIRFT